MTTKNNQPKRFFVQTLHKQRKEREAWVKERERKGEREEGRERESNRFILSIHRLYPAAESKTNKGHLKRGAAGFRSDKKTGILNSSLLLTICLSWGDHTQCDVIRGSIWRRKGVGVCSHDVETMSWLILHSAPTYLSTYLASKYKNVNVNSGKIL